MLLDSIQFDAHVADRYSKRLGNVLIAETIEHHQSQGSINTVKQTDLFVQPLQAGINGRCVVAKHWGDMVHFSVAFLPGRFLSGPTDCGVESNTINPCCLGCCFIVVSFCGSPKLKGDLLEKVVLIMGRAREGAHNLQQQTLMLGQPFVKAAVSRVAFQLYTLRSQLEMVEFSY